MKLICHYFKSNRFFFALKNIILIELYLKNRKKNNHLLIYIYVQAVYLIIFYFCCCIMQSFNRFNVVKKLLKTIFIYIYLFIYFIFAYNFFLCNADFNYFLYNILSN